MTETGIFWYGDKIVLKIYRGLYKPVSLVLIKSKLYKFKHHSKMFTELRHWYHPVLLLIKKSLLSIVLLSLLVKAVQSVCSITTT